MLVVWRDEHLDKNYITVMSKLTIVDFYAQHYHPELMNGDTRVYKMTCRTRFVLIICIENTQHPHEIT